MMAERPPSDSCEGGCFIAVGVVRLSTATLLPRRYCAVVTTAVNAAGGSRRCLLQETQARPQDGCTHCRTATVGEIELSTTSLLPRCHGTAVTAAVTAGSGCRCVLQVAQARPRRSRVRGCTATVGEVKLSTTTLLPRRYCAAATDAVTAAASGRSCLLQVAQARPRLRRTHGGTTAVGRVGQSAMTRLLQRDCPALTAAVTAADLGRC